jgi:hypothetical protein
MDVLPVARCVVPLAAALVSLGGPRLVPVEGCEAVTGSVVPMEDSGTAAVSSVPMAEVEGLVGGTSPKYRFIADL